LEWFGAYGITYPDENFLKIPQRLCGREKAQFVADKSGRNASPFLSL
jgi:hypothetical protein